AGTGAAVATGHSLSTGHSLAAEPVTADRIAALPPAAHSAAAVHHLHWHNVSCHHRHSVERLPAVPAVHHPACVAHIAACTAHVPAGVVLAVIDALAVSAVRAIAVALVAVAGVGGRGR